MSDPTRDPNERTAFGTEQPASEEEQLDVAGHRFLGTEDPDERTAFGTEQAEVEGHRLTPATEQDERIVFGTDGEPAAGDEGGEPDVEGHRYH